MVTLAEEEPFSAVVKDDFLAVACSYCFAVKEERPLLKCLKCKVINYCNKECQKNDFRNHEHECQFFQKSGKVPPYICRLISRIAMKVKRADTKTTAFNGRKYEDLMDHREEIQSDPVRSKIFENIYAILTDFMGEKHVPRKEELLSIYGRIHTNSIGIRTMYDVGSALYVGISIHDHSCRPDAYYTFEKGKIILRSPNKKTKYNTELNINYIDLTKTTKERKNHLSSHYYFECNCERCSDEENFVWEQSGYSECCPDSISVPVLDSDNLKCFKCGNKVKLTGKEVQSANDEVIITWESITKEKTVNILQVMKTYEKYSKIFSPYNLNLFLFSKNLLDFSLEKQNPTLMVKYANAVLPVYEHYLTMGNPALSYGLQNIATAKLFAAVKLGKPDKTIVDLLQKAVEASEISHGSNHLVTNGIRQIMVKNMSFLLQ